MDNNLQDMIAKAVVDIIKQKEDNKGIKVGVSARHVHLSQEHLEILFGKGHELTVKKMLMGDQFAAEECVTLVSPSLRTIEGVRVLGPVRKQSQVEISRTDTFKLKVSPPVRPSGELKGSAPMALVGPKGSIFLNEGCIIANRHIHMTPQRQKSMELRIMTSLMLKSKTQNRHVSITFRSELEKTLIRKCTSILMMQMPVQ